jgi:type IV pilus assembly protein PilN
MIQINLLRSRQNLKKQRVVFEIHILIVFVVLLCAALLCFNRAQDRNIERIKVKISNAEAGLKIANRKADEVRSIQKIIDNLKVKTEAIAELEKSRTNPAILLFLITELLVKKKMWLTSLHMSKNNITLSGIAFDNKTVADFMTRIENAKDFEDLRLKSTRQERNSDNLNLKSFMLTFKWKNEKQTGIIKNR